MMKSLVSLFVSVVLTVGCGCPATNNVASKNAATNTNVNANVSLNENAYMVASWSEQANLRPFVGKTATEMNFWRRKEVSPRLEKLMGADYALMRRSWNVETPLKKFGDILMMTGCEKSNCADNRYVIFIDSAEGDFNVVHITAEMTQEWTQYKDIYLPPPFEKELAAMKKETTSGKRIDGN